MNWYEHHLRGYDADTQHLSWDQDMAYTRLLRWYYRKEQPLPADLDEICRQVRAIDHRDAVQTVLLEFFQQRADGWHRKDCDEAIARYQAGEPAREQKKTNEETRLQRHRGERAALFHVINDAGLHRPWNLPIAKLRELVAELKAATAEDKSATPATPSATFPATETATPATGTYYPLPTTHYPSPLPNPNPNLTTHDVARTGITVEKVETAVSPETAESRALLSGAVCLALKAEGITDCDPGHLRLVELLDRGAKVQHFISAAAGAKDKAHPFAYVLGTVQGQLADAEALVAHARAGNGARGKRGNGGNGAYSGSAARAARMREASPNLAADAGQTIEVEAQDVTARSMDRPNI